MDARFLIFPFDFKVTCAFSTFSRTFMQEVKLMLEQRTRLSIIWYRSAIFRVITSRRVRWAGHVARMGERRGVYRVLVGKREGKRPFEDPGVDGRII